MKTAQEWIAELEESYERQKRGEIKPSQAKEMNNTIGKVIAVTKLQLDYEKNRQKDGTARVIPMLEAAVVSTKTRE